MKSCRAATNKEGRKSGYGGETTKGIYRLVDELRAKDTVAYKELMRMNYETFSEIFLAIESEISKKIIKPAVRLTLALRFLATSKTFTSLHF